MTDPTRIRRRELEAELREIKRFEAEDRAASPKVVGTPGDGELRGRFLFSTRKRIVERQDCRCARCGTSITPATADHQIDHILPLELGGEHSVENAQALCIPCHKAKTREDVKRIAKAKRQAKLMQPREPSKHPIRSRGFR